MHSARLMLTALVMSAVFGALTPAWATDEPLTVRITSPLGRTGSYGAIRVVAQVRFKADVKLPAPPTVRFFVDGKPIGEDTDGPPYAVEWIDENPFEKREISVEVTDAFGATANDRITLEPFEITEVSDVVGVVLEATVEDEKGQAIGALQLDSFHHYENGEPQTVEMVNSDTVPATYVILLDSSQSMARRIDVVRDAARRLTKGLKPEDRVMVVPFSKALGPVTGPTDDRETVVEAI